MLPIHLNHTIYVHVSNFDHHRDILVIDSFYLDTYGICLHMGSNASAQPLNVILIMI